MRVLMWRAAMLALGTLVVLMQPVTRTVGRLAGRLNHWRDQAEIGWLLALASAKLVAECRRRGDKPLAVSVWRREYRASRERQE